MYPGQTSRSAASGLGLHCLTMSHKKDARRILANERRWLFYFGCALDVTLVNVLDSRPKGREFEPHRRHCLCP